MLYYFISNNGDFSQENATGNFRIIIRIYGNGVVQITYYSSECRATLMESFDFYCYFYDEVVVMYDLSKNQWKVLEGPSGLSTGSYYEHAKLCYLHCLEEEKIIRFHPEHYKGCFPIVMGKRPVSRYKIFIKQFPPKFMIVFHRNWNTSSNSSNMSLQSSTTSSVPSSLSTRSTISARSMSDVSGKATETSPQQLTKRSGHSVGISAPGSPLLSSSRTDRDRTIFIPSIGWASVKANGEASIHYAQGEIITLSSDCRRIDLWTYITNAKTSYAVSENVLRSVQAGSVVDDAKRIQLIGYFKSNPEQFISLRK